MQRRTIGAVAMLVVAAALSTPAWASNVGDAAPTTVRVEQVALEADGRSRLVVSVTGLGAGRAIEPGDVVLVENGARVRDLAVTPVTGDDAGVLPAVVLAVDTSGSTDGAPLTAAVAAGQQLVAAIEEVGGLTGVVEFGPQVAVQARLDEPPGTSATALSGLVAGGETRLFDGVARAVRMLGDHDGPRDLVVFSDGADTVSTGDLDTARSLAVDGGVRVTVVALETEDFDIAPLAAIAAATDGSLTRVEAPEQLLATFRGVAQDLTTRFELTWSSDPVPVPPSELSFEVRLSAADVEATDAVVALNPRVPAITEPVPYRPLGPPVPQLAATAGLVVTFASVFLVVLLIAGVALSGAGERRRRERLARRLEGWDGHGTPPEDAIIAAASLSDRAADAVDRLPKPRGLEERLFQLLERADWPMRPSEFQLVTVATAIGGATVPLVLTRSVALAVLGGLVGLAGPTAALRFAVSRRVRAFEDQLPSVLSLLAGALRAGHSFHTALEGTIRETDEPAHSELRRAAVEHRLGRPIADSLRGVGDRMHSTDLRWVVTAIAIQQEVGGNLAELLDNVARTLRDRASLGRTVRALSAEGKLSAWIIGLMPFGMFVVLTAINPEYVALLSTRRTGQALIGLALVLLAIGSLWLRHIVRPRF